MSTRSAQQYRLIRRLINQATTLFPFWYSLDLLAFKHGTDKRKHGYIDHYARYFQKRRHQRLKVIEIGVKKGASLRMWRDYFHRSTIFGIDIEYSKKYDERRIKTFQGSQNDPDFLRKVIDEVGPPDIIIDDGSHMNEHVITSFETLFPLLNADGWYVVEDLQTAYWPSFGGSSDPSSRTATSMNLLKNLIDGLNYQWIPDRQHQPHDQSITALYFHPKIVFIQKGVNREPFFTDAELSAILNGDS